MANEIQKSGASGLTTGAAVNMQAKKLVNIGHADSVTTGDITTNVYVLPGNQGQQCMPGFSGMDHEYYNLFVGFVDESDYREHPVIGSFYALNERSLNSSYTSDYIRDEVHDLNPDAIARIKTFPSIFCAENHLYGKTDDEQKAYYGFVTDVKVQDNGIKIFYRFLNEIQQQVLNDNLFYLGIDGNNRFNELNHTHWAIKRIDLVEALKEIGISVFTLS